MGTKIASKHYLLIRKRPFSTPVPLQIPTCEKIGLSFRRSLPDEVSWAHERVICYRRPAERTPHDVCLVLFVGPHLRVVFTIRFRAHGLRVWSGEGTPDAFNAMTRPVFALASSRAVASTTASRADFERFRRERRVLRACVARPSVEPRFAEVNGLQIDRVQATRAPV